MVWQQVATIQGRLLHEDSYYSREASDRRNTVLVHVCRKHLLAILSHLSPLSNHLYMRSGMVATIFCCIWLVRNVVYSKVQENFQNKERVVTFYVHIQAIFSISCAWVCAFAIYTAGMAVT